MKRIMLLVTIVLAGKQGSTQATGSVPAALLLPDSVCWLVVDEVPLRSNSALSANCRAAYQTGGQLLAGFSFYGNNRFRYFHQLTIYGYLTETQSTTVVEGEILVKEEEGCSFFVTRADRGECRVRRNGITSVDTFSRAVLAKRFSTVYLWRESGLADSRESTYLFLVDLKKHPQADLQHPETIEPAWISRFHISSLPFSLPGLVSGNSSVVSNN